MPDITAMNAAIQQAIHPPEQQHKGLPPGLIQALMYGLQAVDAVTSARDFKQRGAHETNPMMQPFSHGGFPTMAAGFGIGDLIRHLVTRHASQGTRNTLDAAQAASNIEGILQTVKNLHQPPGNP